ncbi:MAG: glycosyltransferase [Microcoleaceae cyanobacterium MO_207.B10]|nr:glycosyltransferase [Microcoleaceae cyanobacterium MO_207.B10]
MISLKNYEESTNNFVSGFQTRLLPLLVDWFYPWADNIVAVSQGLARNLETEYQWKYGWIQTTYNPVINQTLFTKAEASLNHPWFADTQPPVILGVGRLSEEKDFATLIRSFAKVREKKAVRLIILGEGKERSPLEKLVKKLGLEADVLMPGFVDNPYPYIARAAVFVLSSIREGLPTVLIEAMTLNTPVVSTNCQGEGAREILDNGKYGDIVPVGDTEAIAKAIIKILEGDRKIVDRDWLEQFTIDIATEKYLKIIGANLELKIEN